MQSFLTVSLMALAATATPIAKRQDESWEVTSFASSVAAHSITQHTSFSVTVPATNETFGCSYATGAVLSADPFLATITNAPCATGSGFNFTFKQVDDFAIQLDVQNAAGVVETYTSPPNEVVVISTGSTPLDVETLYWGPEHFDLVVKSSDA